MTERELEQRLRTHLHRRFDGAQPPAELLASVRQSMSTPPRRLGLTTFRAGAFRPGWLVLAAVIVVAVVAFASFQLRILDPGAKPSPTPSSTLTTRQFIVLPPAGYDQDKTDSTLASEVLNARLRALLFTGDFAGGFSSAGGNAITFELPTTGPSDESVRSVLRAPGVVEFVPLPESYSKGAYTAEIGQPLPTDETTLFGWDGIASAATELDQQNHTLVTLTLRPPAAQALNVYTESHVGATLAVVLDGDVAMLPTTNEPISDGKLALSGGGVPGSGEQSLLAETIAIVAGGKLPDAWIIPIVPELRTPSDLEAELEFEFGKVEPAPPGNIDITVTSAQLDAILAGPRWMAVWRVQLDGLQDVCPTDLSADERGICRWTDPTVTHLFDAETLDWLGPAPS